MLNLGRVRLLGAVRQYTTRAVDIVHGSLVVDMLGLLTLDWRKLAAWQKSPRGVGPQEFAKLEVSGINVFHPAVELGAHEPRAATARWLNDWRVFLDRDPERFLRVCSAADLARAKQQGKIGVVLGMQNSSHFESRADVAWFHALGQHVSQITYNSKNRLGSGCIERRDDGLTRFGISIIEEMNRVGMAVDVSHTGERTTLQAIEASGKPVLITHGNCKTLSPHPRCKSDKVIRALARRGGVVGITSIRTLVNPSEPTTIEHALNHFDHVARLAGVEYVGVGSDTDLDGRDRRGPRQRLRFDIAGLNHPRRIYDLTEGLLRRGYSQPDIELILGGNFLRALGEIWRC